MNRKETDLTELNKLEQLLREAGIPFQRTDSEKIPKEEVERLDYPHYFDFHKITYPSETRPLSDVICYYGSYGWEDGLLEQMGLLPPCVDSVQGHLTAEEVFSRWKEHYERSLPNESKEDQ